MYRYEVNKLCLVFEDGITELPSERLIAFYIEDNYLDNIYPVISIRLAMEQSVYNKIIANKSSMKIQLDLRKFWLNDDKQSLKSAKEAFMNETFDLILDDAVNTLTTSTHNLEFPEGDTNEMNALTTTLELYLFPSTVNNNTELINMVIKNTSVSDAVGKVLKEAKITKNVVMAIPDNKNIISELVIPPLKLSKALGFIDSYYGIYSTGAIIYFGIDRSYIIPYCKRVPGALVDDEPECVNIVVPKMGSEMTDKLCTVVRTSEPTTPYVIADQNTFNPQNQDVSAKVLYAADVQVVENQSSSVTKSSNKNKKVIVLPSENSFYKESYTARLNAVQTVLEVTLKDCDFTVFTPNKVYQFLFEDTTMMKQYQGKYHLVKYQLGITKEEDNLRGGAVCTFHKNVG
jgi:hypothetical protein